MSPPPSTRIALAGIFVGGASSRMQGRPKGLLVTPSGETIVGRWRRMFDERGIPTVLVGVHEVYAPLGIESIGDEPAGIGPIGGLVALLARAGGRRAIAVGCDMPFVSGLLLDKLAHHPSHSCALAPKRGSMWEPLFARFEGTLPREVAEQHARSGRRSLFGVLDAVGAEQLVLSEDELAELRDWDVPSDLKHA
jgi:molybdopterin-guanine dinucleotide biosynthesis protein A